MKRAPLPQASYPDGCCLRCGKPARTFTSREVPQVLAFIRGEIAGAVLEAAARNVLPGDGCLVAHLSGVSICAKTGASL